MMKRLARKLRGLLAAPFVEHISPSRAFPNARVTPHLESESIRIPNVGRLPLPDCCSHFRTGMLHTRAGYTMPMSDVLYYPEQNLILTSQRQVIVPDNHGRIRRENLNWAPFFRRKSKHLDGIYTTLRSFRWSYYQTLIDQLPMLHVLAQAVPAETVRLAYVPPLSPAEEFYLKPSLPSWVDLFPVEPGTLYRFEHYLYASYLSTRYSGALPRVFVDRLLAQFAPARKRRRDRLIYVSRSEATKGRRILNEEELLDLIQPLGFERLVLGRMEVRDQIEAFYDARAIIAPHGAGLANLHFAQGAEVLELFPEPVVWPHFYLICQSRGLEHSYICANALGRHADFHVDVSEVFRWASRTLA